MPKIKCPCRVHGKLGYECKGGIMDSRACQLPMLTDYMCDWSLQYFNKARWETINELMLHGLTYTGAKDLIARIEDREVPFLLYTGDYETGRRNCYHKYTPASIRAICKDLQDRPKLSCATIARIHKVPRNLVHSIKNSKTWAELSSQFDFSERDKIWGKYNPRYHNNLTEE